MIIESYSQKEHLPLLTRWLKAHGLKPRPELLPADSGFVADGCAIGFLVRTNSRRAEIDNVAADPGVTPARRDAALKALFLHLEAMARSEGYLVITALATLPAMRRRFEGRGYARHGEYGLYHRNLGG